jgi:transposase
MRTPIQVRELTPDELAELDKLYRQTKKVRIRERTQIILLASEQSMAAPEIAKIIRRNEQTVRTWIKRFNAEGIAGLSDAPRSGTPPTVTPAYRERLLVVARRRPRTLEQPYSLWTLQRLADFMAEETGIRVSAVTISRLLAANDIVLSRPQHKVSSPDPEYEVKKRRLKSSATTSNQVKSSITQTNSMSVGTQHSKQCGHRKDNKS